MEISIFGIGNVGQMLSSKLICSFEELIALNLFSRQTGKLVSVKNELEEELFLLKLSSPKRSNTKIYLNNYERLINSDYVILSVGDINLNFNSENRDGEYFFNIQQIDTIIPRIIESGFSGKIILISNPCDKLLTYIAKKYALGPEKIVSLGTAIDTVRLRMELSRLSVNLDLGNWFVIGKHDHTRRIVYCGSNQRDLEILKESIKLIENLLSKRALDTFLGKGYTNITISRLIVQYIDCTSKGFNFNFPLAKYFQNQGESFSTIPSEK